MSMVEPKIDPKWLVFIINIISINYIHNAVRLSLLFPKCFHHNVSVSPQTETVTIKHELHFPLPQVSGNFYCTFCLYEFAYAVKYFCVAGK